MGYGCLPPLYSIWRPPAVLRCNKGQKKSLPERQIEMIARPKEFRVQCRNRDRIFWKGCVGGSAHRQDINRGDLITNGSIAIDELVDEARIRERYAYLRQDSHRRQNRHGGKGRKLCGPVIVQSDSNKALTRDVCKQLHRRKDSTQISGYSDFFGLVQNQTV